MEVPMVRGVGGPLCVPSRRGCLLTSVCLPASGYTDYGGHLEHMLHPRVQLGQLRTALEVEDLVRVNGSGSGSVVRVRVGGQG